MECVPGRKEGKKSKRDISNTVGVKVELEALFNDVCMRFAMHYKVHILCSKTCLIRGQEAVWCTVLRVE